MTKDLTTKHCVPCEGGVPPLTSEQIKEYEEELRAGWQIFDSEVGKKIRKEFIFKNFKEALAFVNKVGEIAESEQHHPDIHLISYKKVIIELSTHAIGGLSENDFIVAAQIESLE